MLKHIFQTKENWLDKNPWATLGKRITLAQIDSKVSEDTIHSGENRHEDGLGNLAVRRY